MGVVQGYVPRPIHATGRAGTVVTIVFEFETGWGVGDGDHPHVYREDDVLPRVCFRAGSYDSLFEHAQD